jgi:hypothetical protein
MKCPHNHFREHEELKHLTLGKFFEGRILDYIASVETNAPVALPDSATTLTINSAVLNENDEYSFPPYLISLAVNCKKSPVYLNSLPESLTSLKFTGN